MTPPNRRACELGSWGPAPISGLAPPKTLATFVRLHDTKLKYQFSHKLDYRWVGPYRIADLVRDKGTCFLEEPDGTRLQGTYAGNRLKFFHLRDPTTRPNPVTAATSSQGATTSEGGGRSAIRYTTWMEHGRGHTVETA